MALTSACSLGPFALRGGGQPCLDGPPVWQRQIVFAASRVDLFNQMRQSRPRLCKESFLDRGANDRLDLSGEDAGSSAPPGPPGKQSIHALILPVETDEAIQSWPADAELPSDL